MLAIDLFCGLGGWAEGFLAEGWDVVGFDIERHCYAVPEVTHDSPCKGTKPIDGRGWTQGCAVTLGLEGSAALPRTKLLEYPAQLVLQDVLTLHGSQFRDADCIVASPPCQRYSYMAMPWSRAKREIQWEKWNQLSPFSPRGFDLNDLFDACFHIQREASEAARHHIPIVVENVKGAQPWVGSAKWHYGSYYLWGDVPALMPHTRARMKFPADCGPRRWKDREVVRLNGGASHAFHQQASAQIAKIPFELASWIARCYLPSCSKAL